MRQPPGDPLSLNGAVDQLLKNAFDRDRGATAVSPHRQRASPAPIPAAHPELVHWRHNFTGARIEHAPSALTIHGALDDLWAHADGTHYVVDYKATSKKDAVNLDAGWQGGDKRQIEFCQWLLRGRGWKVADRAWFVCANDIKEEATFDDVLAIRTRLIASDGDARRIEPMLGGVTDCLASVWPPAAAPECEYCSYAARAVAISGSARD